MKIKAPTQHKKLIQWVREMARMARPEKIVWIDGSEEEKKKLEEEAVQSGELVRLNPKKLPGCFYHRSDPSDVARSENLTYICTQHKSDAGPTNNWMSPKEAYKRARKIFSGSMKGRTLYVIPFSMGPVGSSFSKVGVEITDSIYVVLNMRIMTRIGQPVLDQLGSDGSFTKCMHGKADLNIGHRLILHFPEENTIWSVGSGYGGNALLGKKCLALRIASYLGKREEWMAEHMLILGIEKPNGQIQYIAAAFPSACGKTNLAMLVPPEGMKKKGYRIWTVGDDIAWMRIDTDGGLWAINPEAGFFGVAPGTNSKSNPNAVLSIQKNTIYTNVALKPDGTVWWEGADGEIPEEALDWRGKPWKPGLVDEAGNPLRGAHPNSRFTAPISQCPSISFRLEQHHGVPISAILFGGRRARLAPLVMESFDWNHGVYLGATVASEKTAAAEGVVGEVRRDPMAMLPFCGYHMGDYFKHWMDMGKKLEKQPRIFHVNWFRQDKDGQYLWPGFGENLRVLEWVLNRCEDKVAAVKTSIGYLPNPKDIDTTGLSLPKGALHELLSVNIQDWRAEQEEHEKYFKQFGNRLPTEMWRECHSLKRRLG
ncbi:MAG: phosphoenolpyruvate carboxykinase (GTP) [Elusimicrobia bacterium]|nr:phosphoenolpyruvate carboxykinase (GTP) [Elusimicrobiota bacterium]